MNTVRPVSGRIVTCLLEILIGLLLFIDPVKFTAGIIVLVGIALAVLGVIAVVHYFGTDPLLAVGEHSLAKGLVALVLGAFCIFQSRWFISTFPVLTVLYGLAILLTGILKLQDTVDMLRLHLRRWYVLAIGAAVTILFAVIILMNPFTSTVLVWRFVALSLMIEAILDVLGLCLTRRPD